MDAVRVAVMFDTSFAASAEIYEGVADVARTKPWDLVPLHSNQEAVLRQALAAGRLNGVIAPFMSDRWIDALARPQIAMVNIAAGSQIRSAPSIVPDDRAVGRLAARHLLDSGHRGLACVYMRSDSASQYRYDGFAEEAGKAGVDVMVPDRSAGFGPSAGWRSWLTRLNGSVGLFATDDFLARQVIMACRAAACSVPEKVAVLGVGDSTLDSVLCGIGISSVVLPFFEIGQRAALRLARVMGGNDACVTERISPERVAVRASSAMFPALDPLVSQALGIIDMRLAAPPSVSDLAQLLGASRRSLEMHFRAALGHGPAREMRMRRMALARQLLKSSSLSLSEIAVQCGYANVHYFTAQFKAINGAPPGRWRLQQ